MMLENYRERQGGRREREIRSLICNFSEEASVLATKPIKIMGCAARRAALILQFCMCTRALAAPQTSAHKLVLVESISEVSAVIRRLGTQP